MLPLIGAFLLVPTDNLKAQTATSEFQLLLDSLKQLDAEQYFTPAKEFGESILKKEGLASEPKIKMDILYTLANVYFKSDEFEKGQPHAEEIIDIAYVTEDYTRMVKAYDLIGLAFFEYSEYDSTKFYLFKSASIAEDHDLDLYPRTLVNMAWINGLMDNEEEEIGYYIKSLEVVETKPLLDQKGGIRAKAYGGLGDYYTRNGDYEEASQYFEKKLALGKETENITAQFESYLGLGTLYSKEDFLNVEKGEEAYFHLTRDTLNATPFVHGLGYLGLGRLYVTAEDYPKGLQAFEDAYDIFIQFNSNDYHSRIETEIANIQLKLGNLSSANNWINKALSNATATHLANRERNALRIRYKIDSAQADFRSAFNNYQRYRVIDDSLNSEESKQRIEELEVKYETEQTENQNLLLKNDLAMKEADLKQKAIIQTVFAVVAFLLAVLAYVIYKADRRKKKLNLALKQKNELISKQKEELQFKTDKLQIINSQLKALFDFRKDLTRMIAHDMKNPLNSIIGLSSTINDDKKVDSITKSGYQLLNLVTNMLEVEKMQEVKIDPKKEKVYLDELVKEAREQVELLVAAKSIVFQNLLPKKLCFEGDRHLLVRVLVNLLTNAIKYSENGDVIKIYHQHKGGMLGIVIQDEGAGISSERLPFIFEKFWQGEQRNSGLATSNGLGLTYCKMAIEAHEGKIGVESELGGGTKVTFFLPYNGEEVSPALEVTSVDKNLVFDSELELLSKYWEELNGLKVYEVSRVKTLLIKMEDAGVKSPWVQELLKAVYQGDERFFNSLISAIRPLENS